MNKKIAILSNAPVGPDFNGGSMTTWGLLKGLLDIQNKSNIIVVLLWRKTDKGSNIYNKCLKYLDDLNIEYFNFYYIEHKSNLISYIKNVKNIFLSKPEYYYHCAQLENQISDFLISKKINIAICYHYDSLSCIRYKSEFNVFAFLGDLPNEPRFMRRNILKTNIIKKNILNFFENIYSNKIIKNILKRANYIGVFAHYYVEILNNMEIQSMYIKSPIIDSFHKDLSFENFFSKKNFLMEKDINIMMLGGLHGTVTISGLLFLEKFLKINKDKKLFFKIIGNGNLNKINKNLLNYKNIFFKGRVESLYENWQNNQIFLVPNEITMGLRIRIITAMSYGSIILTHSSNLNGQPELENLYNCLVFNDPKELDNIFKELRSKKIDLQELSRNARLTFEKHYAIKNAFRFLDNNFHLSNLIKEV